MTTKRKFVPALITVALAIFSLPANLFAEETTRIYRDGNGWVQEITGSIAAAKGLKVSSTEGSIQVQGGSSPNVTYTIKKHVYRSSEETARRDMASFEVRVSRRGDYVLLEAEGNHSHGRFSAEFKVTVPKETSWVKLETMGGSVGVNGIDGSVKAETAGGSISVDEIGGPVIAASDWMATLPHGVEPWVPATFVALGTDGFGRSDTRESLRSYFEIDAPHVAAAAMSALARDGQITGEEAARAIATLGIDPDKADPRAS